MQKELQARVAIVTGAGNGIGEAIARRFAEEGAIVVLTDINDQKGQQVADSIKQQGQEACYFHHDVSDEKRWQEVIKETLQKYKKLDILVNNAGMAIPGLLSDTTAEKWQRMININLNSVFYGTRYAVEAMKANGSGNIINLCSVAGITGLYGMSGYCATKGGVKLFTKAVSLECGPLNIRVNCISPGSIDTGIWPEEARQKHQKDSALGRMGQPKEIAEGALFLASDRSSYMLGAELVIDGGYTTGIMKKE